MIKITVSTHKEAIKIARKLSDTYESDEDFAGVIIYVK